MNVVTGFSLGILYDFDDPDFQDLSRYVSVFFENMREMYTWKLIVDNLPVWMTQSKLLTPLHNLNPMKKFVPDWCQYIFRQIKIHRQKLDPANPNDFLGNSTNSSILLSFRYTSHRC